jgi:formylglycine-generating enzyme required for sulfatase activity
MAFGPETGSLKRTKKPTNKETEMNTKMNTQKKTGIAALLATLAMTGAVTVRSAEVGTDYLSDPSLMVAVTGGSESRTHESETNQMINGTFGAVSYDYSIGKYEVTNAQYATFLNALAVTPETQDNTLGLYNPNQASYGLTWSDSQFVGDNRPVVYVSFYDAARFVNWLTNGGTAGSDTEDGMYKFVGGNLTSTPDHATSTGWVIASEDEWYRAAYYNPTLNGEGEAGGYTNYPWAGGTTPSHTQTDVSGANYTGGRSNAATDAGFYINATSHFGTYDQAGNVREWIDTVYSGNGGRVLRGGSFANSRDDISAERGRNTNSPEEERDNVGFRVVRLTSVPEPGAVAGVTGLAMLVIGVLIRLGRRTGRG